MRVAGILVRLVAVAVLAGVISGLGLAVDIIARTWL